MSTSQVAALIRQQRTSISRSRGRTLGALLLACALIFGVSLCIGSAIYTPGEVLRVLAGETVPGASFTVGELRLPRATIALLGGAAFGMAGATFQTMLGNPLASPDVLGISAGAGAAAVFGILTLGLGDTLASVFALFGALATAAVIFLLSNRGRFVGTRFILMGIGIAAMLQSVTSYLLTQASDWDIQRAMRWLTGSVNGTTWAEVVPLAIATLVLVPCLLWKSRDLETLRLGEDTATALGVPVLRTRVILIVLAVMLLAFATAACGPVMFVSFMAGPIAGRLVGPGTSVLLPAALVGALLVACADFAGQNLFGGSYPVGIVTGVLGAPYLLYLLTRMNRKGMTL